MNPLGNKIESWALQPPPYCLSGILLLTHLFEWGGRREGNFSNLNQALPAEVTPREQRDRDHCPER